MENFKEFIGFMFFLGLLLYLRYFPNARDSSLLKQYLDAKANNLLPTEYMRYAYYGSWIRKLSLFWICIGAIALAINLFIES